MAANRKLIVSIIVLILAALFLCASMNFATDRTVLHAVTQMPQNALAYIKPNKNIKIFPIEQEKLTKNFLNNYFFPWQGPLLPEKIAETKADLLHDYRTVESSPGVGPNTHSYSQKWVKHIENKINLRNFPNFNQNAITIHDSDVRVLPTTEPSFTDLRSVSKGYPFDNLQQTFIAEGTPVRIIHVSKDKLWYLVIACSYSGWIQSKDLAFVSNDFAKQWQTGNYAVSVQDDIPLFDQKRQLATKTRIGVLYPVANETNNAFTILLPNRSLSGEAVAQPLTVSKEFLIKFPLQLSTSNIAKVANNLLGKPYGWGGIYGYRDCSATTKDLLATFGIWLPRNSAGQVKIGHSISLAGLNPKEKEQTIIKHGIPFLSLIYIPGHIVLYIGEENGHPLVFQNMWGLHIYKLLTTQDRIVVGQTVITPLSFGKNFINVSLNHLTAATSMTTLVERSSLTN